MEVCGLLMIPNSLCVAWTMSGRPSAPLREGVLGCLEVLGRGRVFVFIAVKRSLTLQSMIFSLFSQQPSTSLDSGGSGTPWF